MWRAFADETTTEGVHVIFTNDDTLNEVTIKNAYSGALRRFGKIARVKTQDELEKWCSDEVRKLEEAETSNLVLKAFVPITPTVVDPTIDLKINVSIARNTYEEQDKLVGLGLADASTLVPLKQAYSDALAALAGK